MEERINQIGGVLLERHETLAVAESVTQGLLQNTFSLSFNASGFFQGGITVYNVGQKTKQLGVEPIHALEVNGVSEKVANELAIGVCSLFRSNWGIGITGYAATLPEKSVYDLFAFYSFCYQGEIKYSKRIVAEKKDPEEVQRFYVAQLIDDFLERIKQKQF